MPPVDASLARHGGLSYLEIPAADAARSAAFYRQVAGWDVDDRGGGDWRFADRTGHLIGRWVTGRAVPQRVGVVPYLYVDDLDTAVAGVAEHGGEVVKPPHAEGDIRIAVVRDPAGNTLGLWQAAER